VIYSFFILTKIFDAKHPKYPIEYETTVDSKFKDVVKILESAGLENSLKSIKYREKWSFPGANEIVFDLWPGLPIVLEIDCASESALKKTCEKLNLDMNKSFTEYKYTHLFGINKKITEKIPYLNFLNYNKLLKKHVIKNKELFNSLTKDYYNKFIKNNMKIK
jgi:adenylate cyclase class IV